MHSLPLYNAELTTPPANAIPKPNWPILLNNCAIFLSFENCKAKKYDEKNDRFEFHK